MENFAGRVYYNLKWWRAALQPSNALEFQKHRLFMQVRRNTMASYDVLSLLYGLCKQVNREGVDGAFVECGVWKGGCAAVMAAVGEQYSRKRAIHLFDSFEGLPEPTELDGADAVQYSGGRSAGQLSSVNQCVASYQDVLDLLRRLEIDLEAVNFHKGWFQETLPLVKNHMPPIAILRLDGDWYESTKVCLESLYDRVVSGGFVILDDYVAWEGCRKATDEFIQRRKLNVRLIEVRGNVYFRKP
jgi:hypothetical protein